MDLNLHKIDLKGNLIVEYIGIVNTAANSRPFGIETDGNYFWITYGETSVVMDVYVINKKGQVVKSFTAPGVKTLGVTTNGKDLIFSDTASNFNVTDKVGNQVKSITLAGAAPLACSFTGQDILCCDSVGAKVYLVDQKTKTTKKTIPIATVVTGICALHDRFAVIDATKMTYYTYKGNVIKGSIALPTAGGIYVFQDLCHDRDFLWLISTTGGDMEV